MVAAVVSPLPQESEGHMSFIEYIHTGRLWVLPFSRQYEFRSEDGRVNITGARIDSDCFTVAKLEKLTPGGLYMCEFDRDPVSGFRPVLTYIRSEKGEPL